MKKVYVVLLLFFLFVPSARAEDEGITAFKQLKNIDGMDIVVPSVVEVPLDKGLVEWPQFAVLEVETGEFQPSYYIRTERPYNYRIYRDGENVSGILSDDKNNTFVEFDLPENGIGVATLKVSSQEMIKTNTIQFRLSNYVALPNSVEVRAVVGGVEKIVLASSRMRQSTIHFPETSSQDWTIEMTYSQPLRITEMDLRQISYRDQNEESLRFLARPGMSYALYLNPDRYPEIAAGESPNLRDNEGVIRLGEFETITNSLYVKSDVDKDGVIDEIDNCVNTKNEDQKDVDGNLRGDACDDFDRDGVINAKDNCPDKPNANQRDSDSDKIGDVCDDEESRLTEKNPWLVWLGIGLVGLVVVVLLVNTMKSKEE